ncbi:hypothetical protein BJ508DRAFT_411653 [Ascobolus immersus RN42]|uniref:Uncharacterized protein n=1 Tax=Ascobolus immersus RN42 TaxID=1160509 RepID=A0A3N4IWT8_ASCIM|nr:hypothetical protein BJ508DRAFT_411653 [Ascobolus immersus RN42]
MSAPSSSYTPYRKQRSASVDHRQPDLRQKGLPPLPLFSRPEDPVIASLPKLRKVSMSSIPTATRPPVLRHQRSQSAVTVSQSKLGYHLEQHEHQPFDNRHLPTIHTVTAAHKPKLVIRTPKTSEERKEKKERLVAPAPAMARTRSSEKAQEQTRKTSTSGLQSHPSVLVPGKRSRPERTLSPPPVTTRKGTPLAEGRKASNASTLSNLVEEEIYEGVGEAQGLGLVLSRPPSRPQSRGRRPSPAPIQTTEKTSAAVLRAQAVLEALSPSPRTRSFQKVQQWDYMAPTTTSSKKTRARSVDSASSKGDPFHLDRDWEGKLETIDDASENVSPLTAVEVAGVVPAVQLESPTPTAGNPQPYETTLRSRSEQIKRQLSQYSIAVPHQRSASESKVTQLEAWELEGTRKAQLAQPAPKPTLVVAPPPTTEGHDIYLSVVPDSPESESSSFALILAEPGTGRGSIPSTPPHSSTGNLALYPDQSNFQFPSTQQVYSEPAPPSPTRFNVDPALLPSHMRKHSQDRMWTKLVTKIKDTARRPSATLPTSPQRELTVREREELEEAEKEAWLLSLRQGARGGIGAITAPLGETRGEVVVVGGYEAQDEEEDYFNPFSFSATPDLARTRSPSFEERAPRTPVSPVSPVSPTSGLRMEPVSPIEGHNHNLFNSVRRKLSLRTHLPQLRGPISPMTALKEEKVSTSGILVWPHHHDTLVVHRLKPRKALELPNGAKANACAVCQRGPLPTMWLCVDCVDGEGNHCQSEHADAVVGMQPKCGPWDSGYREGCGFGVCRSCANEGVGEGWGELL